MASWSDGAYVAVIVGTRPEWIKQWGILRASLECSMSFYSVHTGQHYDSEMDRDIRSSLGLSAPVINLRVGSESHAVQTAQILEGLESSLQGISPVAVVVQGDTNSSLAAALWAVKNNIAVGHVEAGLRSFDRTMPEEINRVAVDHIANWLYAPTPLAERNLLAEGIESERIVVTGNTVTDAVLGLDEEILASTVVAQMSLKLRQFMFVTLHRPSNVDNSQQRRAIFSAIELLRQRFNLTIAFPLHPRTAAQLDGDDYALMKNWKVSKPARYPDSLRLIRDASLVVTDSGGVQEEACVLGTPSVIVRNNTERPESIEVGAARLGGTCSDSIVRAASFMLGKRGWTNPFGDGRAGHLIVSDLVRRLTAD